MNRSPEEHRAGVCFRHTRDLPCTECDTPIEQHICQIMRDWDSDEYVAGCSCGQFESSPQPSDADAIDRWTDHCDRVFMEATGG